MPERNKVGGRQKSYIRSVIMEVSANPTIEAHSPSSAIVSPLSYILPDPLQLFLYIVIFICLIQSPSL